MGELKSAVKNENTVKQRDINTLSSSKLKVTQAPVESACDPSHVDVTSDTCELVRLREELEASKQREAELTAALDKAQSSVRAKGDFLAHMSHELRSPMTAVIGMSELLMETRLSGEQRDMVSTVRRSAGALVALVNDILDYSKIESGKMTVERRQFNLRECIEECLDLMAPNVQGKPVELLYEMDDDTPEMVEGDSNRVRQIVVNLMSNAIKFTREGQIMIGVSPQIIDERTVTIQVSVRDSGIGIPEDRLELLFADYVQADASTARKYGGTGLGLSISRGLAELMQGSMWVESEHGKGSTFSFTFACTVCDAGASGVMGLQRDLAGRKLLVVEPNEVSRELLVRQAVGWGMEVVGVGDPNEALDQIQTGQFDGAVIDRRLRDGAGNDLYASTHKVTPQLPVVMLTSLAGTATMSGSQSQGGVTSPVSYVSRPVKPARLLQALKASVPTHSDTPTVETPSTDNQPSVRTFNKLDISIIVADDEPSIQSVARRFLEKLGVDAEVVSNGQELLDALHRRSFDVALVDFHMPVMTGLEAAARIRKEFTAETAPYLVAMTGALIGADAEACFAHGIDDVLPKPWGPFELQKTLEDAASIIQWRRERMLVAS